MAAKKAFPLRLNADILQALRHWSDDEIRSVNAQIEYLLRDALRKAGRLSRAESGDEDSDDDTGN